MRRIPCCWIVAAARPVVVPDHSVSFATCGPILAGIADEITVQIRTGQNVMAVWRVTAAIDDCARLGDRGLFGQIVAVTVQIINALRHDHAICVLPRAGSDPIARVFITGRQVGSPYFAAHTGRFGEGTAVGIRPFQSARISSARAPLNCDSC